MVAAPTLRSLPGKRDVQEGEYRLRDVFVTGVAKPMPSFGCLTDQVGTYPRAPRARRHAANPRDLGERSATDVAPASLSACARPSGARKATGGGVDAHGGVMSAMELDDHSHDGTLARHRESTELARDCRRVFEPITPRPRQSDRDIGRIIQIDAWVGSLPQRDGSAQEPAGPAAPARMTIVEDDPGTRAGRADLPRAFGQDVAGVGLEPVGRLGQRRAACAAGAERENECADLGDPHGRTLASTGTELRRLTQGD
jgi:hypothetical protein